MECKNCKSNIDSSNFCSNCGAKVITNRLTFKHFLNEINEKVFDVDNKALKTLLNLLTKPDVVISDYINGVRKKYINPFSFLLFALTLSGISIYFTRDLAIESASEIATRGQAEGMKNFMNLIYDYNSIFISLLIPIYAFISYIVFYNKNLYNYIEHNIIFIYSQAMYTFLGIFFSLLFYFSNLKLSLFFSLFITGVWIIYNTFLLKKLFKLNIKQTIIKVLYFLLLGLFLYIVVIILVGIVMFIIQGPEFFDQFGQQ